MTRREFCWTESEQQAVRAYVQILRAENFSFALPWAMEKSPIRQNGQSRYYKGDGQVQEVTRSITLWYDEERFAEVDMVGQRWRGRFSCTHWHVTDVRWHDCNKLEVLAYWYRTSDVHNPYWSGNPQEHDLRRVMPDGNLAPVVA